MKTFIAGILSKFSSLSRRMKMLLAAAACLLLWFWLCLPKKLFREPACYIIEDADGNLLSASIADDGQWRFPAGDAVPQKFTDCITTFEDRRFFSHPGVDIRALSRAVLRNVQHSGVVQGGSTITMQVIRIAADDHQRTILNKIKESILALRLELSFSKKEIMAMYAAHAPFGGNVVGLEAAAWRYYGRSAARLSWGEMAALAVLPNAPALVHPGKNREVLLSKRNRLLDNLLAAGKIDADACRLAKLEPLPGEPLPLPQHAPHLLQRFKKEAAASGRHRVVTTINGSLQQQVNRILLQHQQLLKGNGINNACALVLDVETGNTLAYAGNVYNTADAELESFNDVIAAPRSPGSTLKPLLYAAMLSDGLILPNSLVPDVPTQIGGYTPQNFDLGYDGAVPAGKALSRSLNIPAVKLLQQYKYQRFYELLQHCGITTLNRTADTYGLSLILGGCEVTMWDIAGVYASMARTLNHQAASKGISRAADFHPPRYTQYPVAQYPNTQLPNAPTLLDPTAIWFTFQAMEEVMRPGEEGLWQQFTSSQKIAWKTGTSFGFRDGWAIGLTPRHVVAVWAGNTDGEGRSGLVGVQTAAPILFDIFRQLPAVPWFEKPRYNYSYVPVCRQSGFRSNTDCPDTDTLFMPAAGNRAPQCPYHRIIHLDETGSYRVTELCASPASMQHRSWFVLSPAMEYYYRQHHIDYVPLPPFKEGCGAAGDGRVIEIVYPQPDAKIYIPLEISGERGRTVFTAAHRSSSARIFWSIDDEFIATTQQFHQLAVNPTPGKHLLTLTDENGATATRAFEVLQQEK